MKKFEELTMGERAMKEKSKKIILAIIVTILWGLYIWLLFAIYYPDNVNKQEHTYVDYETVILEEASRQGGLKSNDLEIEYIAEVPAPWSEYKHEVYIMYSIKDDKLYLVDVQRTDSEIYLVDFIGELIVNEKL